MTTGMAPKSGDDPKSDARAAGARATASVSPRRPLRAPALPAVLAAVALLACRGSGAERELGDDHDDGYGGLVASAEAFAPVDVARAAADPDELVRAVSMPHHRVGDALGPHVFRATSSVEVTVSGGGEPDAREQLDVTARIEYADAQRFRALVENSADYGREILLVDGHLYLRPRYGAFHRRLPNDEDEPAGWRDDVYAELAGHLELLAAGLAVRDGGAADVNGRPARRIELARAERARELPAPALPQRAWRSSVEVESLSGEVFLDQETGVPLRARLEGVARARREQRLLRMHVIVEHEIASLGQMVEIAPPPAEQWVEAPVRSREVEDRERLLEDIAQPARPAPTPENTPTGAGERGRRRAAEEAP